MTTFAERAAQGIARYTPADLDDLRAFQHQQYGARADLVPTSWLEWLERNPHRASDAGPIWICRRNGQIVGQQAEIAVQLTVDGEEVAAAYPIELMVDPVWRLRGVGPALAAAQQAASRVACSIWMNEQARRMYERAGWTDLGTVPRFVALANPWAAIRTIEVKRHRVAAAIAAPFVAGAMRAAASVAHARARSTHLVEVAHFDDRADAIWTSAARDYRVLARRDTASLQWRFDDSPYAGRYRRFYLLHDGEPVGYVVLRRTHWREATTLRIVDYLAPHRWFPVLLAECVAIARRDRSVAFVDLLARNYQERRQLSALGFIPAARLPWFPEQSSNMRLMVSVTEDDPSHRTLTDDRAWFVTSGEADVELVAMQLELLSDG